jgi:Uma2 family endonuclease
LEKPPQARLGQAVRLIDPRRPLLRHVGEGLPRAAVQQILRAMATNPRAAFQMSFEEYLAFEADTPERHEFLDGAIRLMVGASLPHGIVVSRLNQLLANALKGGPCLTVESQTKLKITAMNRVYYPDLMVICDRARETDDRMVQHPSLVAEVLSESTAATDRREKSKAYQAIESLRYYLMVDIDQKCVEIWSRSDGLWITKEKYSAVDLPDLNAQFPVADLFEGL